MFTSELNSSDSDKFRVKIFISASARAEDVAQRSKFSLEYTSQHIALAKSSADASYGHNGRVWASTLVQVYMCCTKHWLMPRM